MRDGPSKSTRHLGPPPPISLKFDREAAYRIRTARNRREPAPAAPLTAIRKAFWPSAKLVSMYYISRTWSWVKVTIWLPSPPMGLTIHIGAQVHGEPRGICYRVIITFSTEVVSIDLYRSWQRNARRMHDAVNDVVVGKGTGLRG